MVGAMDRKHQLAVLAALCAACLLAGLLGGLSTAPAIEGWYRQLERPSWTPPDWVFAPAWTVLYLTMAVAAWLVWRRAGRPGRELALVLFAIQLTLNAAWSPLFFGARLPGVALVDIALLWIAIVATIAAFARVARPAAWLMVPYVLWVTFAAALNTAIWRMNA